jgi:hypothetical protein
MIGILDGNCGRIGWTDIFMKNKKFVKKVQVLKSFILEILFDFFEIKLNVFKEMLKKLFNNIFRALLMC